MDGMNRRRGHNSAGEWAAHLLPGGLPLPIRRETRRAPQLRELHIKHRAEQLREQRLEQRLEQLLEQPAVQRRIQAQVEVKVEVEMERKTQPMTQAITQPATLLPELPDE
jgi:DNA-binding HxlR family transcriptional regulator